MSYLSAKIHLAFTRLIAAYGFAASIPCVDCSAIEVDGNVAYEITAAGGAHRRVVRVLCDALGKRADGESGDTLLSLAASGKMLELAYG